MQNPIYNRLTRRQILRLAALGVGASVLAACGGLPGLTPTATPNLFEQPGTVNNEQPTAVTIERPTAPQVEATAPAATGTAKLELRLDYWDATVRTAVEGFERENPDVKIVLPIGQFDEIQRTASATLTSEQSAPDLVAISDAWLGEFVTANGLVDLNSPPFDASTLASQFVKPIWEQLTIDGRQFGIPWLSFPSGLFYRADVLKQAGFDSEPDALQKQLQRWDDLIDLGVALKRKQNDTMLLADSIDVFWTAIGQAGGLLKDGQVLIAELATRPAELAARARTEGIDANLQQNETAMADFRAGRIVTLIGGLGAAQFISNDISQATAQWRMITPPEGPGNTGSVVLAIPQGSKHKEEAWALITYLTTNAEAQNTALKSGSGLPVFMPAWLDPFYEQPTTAFGDQQLLKLATQLSQQFKPVPVGAYDRTIREALETEMFQVLFAKKDPAQAMQDAEKAVIGKGDGLRG